MKYFETLIEDQETNISILYQEQRIRIYSSELGTIQKLTKILGKPTIQYKKSKTYWSGASWDVDFFELDKLRHMIVRDTFIDKKLKPILKEKSEKKAKQKENKGQENSKKKTKQKENKEQENPKKKTKQKENKGQENPVKERKKEEKKELKGKKGKENNHLQIGINQGEKTKKNSLEPDSRKLQKKTGKQKVDKFEQIQFSL